MRESARALAEMSLLNRWRHRFGGEGPWFFPFLSVPSSYDVPVKCRSWPLFDAIFDTLDVQRLVYQKTSTNANVFLKNGKLQPIQTCRWVVFWIGKNRIVPFAVHGYNLFCLCETFSLKMIMERIEMS